VSSHIRTIHGDSVADDYFWLRDRTDPRTFAFLEAENHRTDEAMKRLEPLQEKLYQEMLSRVQEADVSVPAPFGTYEYFTRTEKGKQYPILCRRPAGAESGEEEMLDCNALAEGTEYFALAFDRVSPDGNFLAFATNTDGDEVYALRFKDLRTGEVLPRVVENVYYSSAWAADSTTFFYTTLDSTKRPHRLWRHRVGSAIPDELVYEEPDARFNVSIARSRSGEFLFLTVDSHTTTEVRYGDGLHGDAFTLLAARIQDVEYYVEHQSDFFYIRTNENAKNFRLMRAAAGDPGRESWVEILPHREEVALEDMAGFQKHLVLVERDRGLKRIRIIRESDTHFVEFDEPAYTFTLDRNDIFETPKLRFSYTSLVTPRSVFDYDMNTGERELRKRYAVLGGYDPAPYASERIWAGAVPISLVYRKGVPLDGSSPLYLYGYGSYGIVTEPSFSSERVSLLDRGVIFAMAHIRGSADLGRKWYDDGKLLHKKNTFADFIACAEHLIAAKYTSPGRLAIVGGSAGGLLMGAVTNMRPDLFKAVVAHVPFVDVVNTMLDPSLPLTITEYEEWGNPNEKVFYEYIKSYAPYENVARKGYPNILVTAGLNDPRVPYWEPAKWVAKLRELKTDSNLLLLKTLMGAGHGGPSGRYQKLREKAFEFAFVLDLIATS
jgi:oligopeptidase B